MSTSPTTTYNDWSFYGSVVFAGSVNIPASIINDSSVIAGANIAETKLTHRHHKVVSVAGTVAAASYPFFIAYKAGTVLLGNVSVDTIPTSTATVTVDIKKSTGGGAYSSILSAPIVISASSTARTAIPLVLSGTPTFVAGDILEVVLSLGGSGTQATNLCIDQPVAELGT